MTTYIYNPVEKTLGEFIANHYAGFTVCFGDAPLDMDISHGIEVKYVDNRAHNHGEYLALYPFILWSDGGYNSCHSWGSKYYLILLKKSKPSPAVYPDNQS